MDESSHFLTAFFIGVGFAINAPAWTSIVRQVISDAELPSAATLGSLQLGIAGIIGPLLGGLFGPVPGAQKEKVFRFSGRVFEMPPLVQEIGGCSRRRFDCGS